MQAGQFLATRRSLFTASAINERGNVLGTMPYPENHVEAIIGCTGGRGARYRPGFLAKGLGAGLPVPCAAL
jgi:hypothetical protein